MSRCVARAPPKSVVMAYLREIVNLKEMFGRTRLKIVLSSSRKTHQLPLRSREWWGVTEIAQDRDLEQCPRALPSRAVSGLMSDGWLEYSSDVSNVPFRWGRDSQGMPGNHFWFSKKPICLGRGFAEYMIPNGIGSGFTGLVLLIKIFCKKLLLQEKNRKISF